MCPSRNTTLSNCCLLITLFCHVIVFYRLCLGGCGPEMTCVSLLYPYSTIQCSFTIFSPHPVMPWVSRFAWDVDDRYSLQKAGRCRGRFAIWVLEIQTVTTARTRLQKAILKSYFSVNKVATAGLFTNYGINMILLFMLTNQILFPKVTRKYWLLCLKHRFVQPAIYNRQGDPVLFHQLAGITIGNSIAFLALHNVNMSCWDPRS